MVKIRRGEKMLLRDFISSKKGLLIDIEGTLISEIEYEKAFPDTYLFLEILKQKNFLLLTNLARKSRKYVSRKLSSMKINVPHTKIINPTIVAAIILEEKYEKPVKVFLIGENGHLEDLLEFAWIELTDHEKVNAVLLGASRNITYQQLNFAFRQILHGADLIVLGGETWSLGKIYDDEGEFLMEGAFAAALEAATGIKAIRAGKPSEIFFEVGLKKLGLDKHEVVMIGDSLQTDVTGALSYGIDVIYVNRKSRSDEEIIKKLANVKKKSTLYIVNSLNPSEVLKALDF